MVSLLYSVIALTCVVFLLISLMPFRKVRDVNDPTDRAFSYLTQWVLLFCFHDAIWGILASDCVTNDKLLFVSSSVFHAAAAVTAFLWLNYTLQFLGKRIKNQNYYRFPALVVVLFQIVLLLWNIDSKFLFFVNEEGVYEATLVRHILFYSQYAIYIAIFVLCAVKMINAVPKDSRKFKVMLLCVMAPIVSGILQMAFPDAPFYSIGYTIGCLTIFTHIVFRLTKDREYQQHIAIMTALTADYDFICYVDAQFNEVSFRKINKRFRNIYDKENNKIPSNKRFDNFLKAIIVPEDFPGFLKATEREAALKVLEENNSFVTKFRIRIDNVTEFYEMKIARDNANKPFGFVIGMHNVSEEIKRAEEAQKLKTDLEKTTLIANRDPLTGVSSRAAFNQKCSELAHDISQGKSAQFAIVECDLNNLKTVNDHFGHEAGDAYIKKNCSVFCETFKHSPVYRIGGDEFVIWVQGQDYDERNDLMDKLFLQLEIQGAPSAEKVSFAAGLAEFNPQIDESAKDVLKRADTFMYINKKQIKNIL